MARVTVSITVDTEDEIDYVGQMVYDALRTMFTTVDVPVDEYGEELDMLEDPIWFLESSVATD